MNQQKLESALWRACLYIPSFRNCSEEVKKHIADDLYDFFLRGDEHQRFDYKLEELSKNTDNMIAKWPQWKRGLNRYDESGEQTEPY